MVTLFLARHGETSWSAVARYTGSSDIPLTDRGREQAEALGRWAAHARLDALYSSPLQRCRTTADAASRTTGLEVVIRDDLREVHYGRGEGLTLVEMGEVFRAERDAYVAAPATSPLPSGEAGIAALARADAELQRVAAAHPDGRVLVVAHSTILRLWLTHLLGVGADRYRDLFPRVEPAALTTVALRPTGWALLGFNEAPF